MGGRYPFDAYGCGTVELELSSEDDIKKSARGLLGWWILTYRKATQTIRARYSQIDLSKALMIVHGDTVSTYMGARIGRSLGMIVCHVEAGLRSHHLFNPFPEEIDRLLTSRVARIHFAPGNGAASNLKYVKGRVINTRQNTLVDSLRMSSGFPLMDEDVRKILGSGKLYFVFVMHRQENLINEIFFKKILDLVMRESKNMRMVFILHKITENKLRDMDLLNDLKNNEDVSLVARVNYFDFMKLLVGAEYVITDGGSNQEELYYMGKPCFILRNVTERTEGLGKNAVLLGGAEAA